MDNEISTIFPTYSQIILLDLETTGLSLEKDQIIELAAIKYSRGKREEIDILIKMPLNCPIPKSIIKLTGITDQMLINEGVLEEEAMNSFLQFIETDEETLFISHNIQFDLSFLLRSIKAQLKEISIQYDVLDTLTIFRDRKPYPNRLEDAIEYYNIENAKNSHRAIDDVKALNELIKKLDTEKSDLLRYINLIGVHKKHGLWGQPLPRVRYCIQFIGEKNKTLPDFLNEGKRLFELEK